MAGVKSGSPYCVRSPSHVRSRNWYAPAAVDFRPGRDHRLRGWSANESNNAPPNGVRVAGVGCRSFACADDGQERGYVRLAADCEQFCWRHLSRRLLSPGIKARLYVPRAPILHAAGFRCIGIRSGACCRGLLSVSKYGMRVPFPMAFSALRRIVCSPCPDQARAHPKLSGC